jgi:hypothetical protein
LFCNIALCDCSILHLTHSLFISGLFITVVLQTFFTLIVFRFTGLVPFYLCTILLAFHAFLRNSFPSSLKSVLQEFILY